MISTYIVVIYTSMSLGNNISIKANYTSVKLLFQKAYMTIGMKFAPINYVVTLLQ